jgi:hypothetical protein
MAGNIATTHSHARDSGRDAFVVVGPEGANRLTLRHAVHTRSVGGLTARKGFAKMALKRRLSLSMDRFLLLHRLNPEGDNRCPST